MDIDKTISFLLFALSFMLLVYLPEVKTRSETNAWNFLGPSDITYRDSLQPPWMANTIPLYLGRYCQTINYRLICTTRSRHSLFFANEQAWGSGPSRWSITQLVLFDHCCSWSAHHDSEQIVPLWPLKIQCIIAGNLLNVLSNIKISHVVKVKSLKDMCVRVKVWISWSVDLHFTLLSPNWELPAYYQKLKAGS